MRKDSAQFQMLALCELARKTLDVARRDAQTIHARVHLQVERSAFAALLAAFLGKDAGGGTSEEALKKMKGKSIRMKMSIHS